MVSIDLSSSPLKLIINSSQLKLPPPYQNVSQLTISCPDLVLSEMLISCQQGKIAFKGLINQTEVESDFTFNFDKPKNSLEFALENLHLSKSELSLAIKLTNDKWSTSFKAIDLDYKYFKTLIQDYLKQYELSEMAEKLAEAGAIVSFSGQANGYFNNTSSESVLNVLKIKGKISELHYQYGDDMAENLALNFSSAINLKQNKKKTSKADYDVSLSVNALSGEILQSDTYVSLTGKEKLRSRFTIYNNQRIHVAQLSLGSKGIIELNAKGWLDYKKPLQFKQLDSSLEIINLAGFNQYYLNNILSGTDYEEIKVEGALTAHFRINKNKITANTKFRDFSVELNENLAMVALNGKLNWNNKSSKAAVNSYLSWQELLLNGLPLGAAKFDFVFHNDYLSLLKGTDIPIFDGALHINSLEIDHIHPSLAHQNRGTAQKNISNKAISKKNKEAHSKGMTLTVDGMIKPVSLALLSEHYDWPLLAGSLSAVIPSTTYNEQYLTVGGALMLKVFDGVVIIKDLRIDEPLQDYAQLFANIDLINLSLESLTKTYNFGQIEGRIGGYLHDLELSAWEPVAFDASLKTPENDDSRHRISQTAIDNISSLGGASGLLSRTFLSFFESFRYDKIGLSCKLKNNVCQMSGVEAKGNSYYIVKGGGIPRIDVMGFQRQVSWSTLTSRLKAIQLANEATIE
ncbi:hypothetical protein [sulfur-oxidizing endosymbiont of Gigantopelta aegis]|uniref:hypothetical protein n=1 Tax=sulfur-oxidizing endosymbiont of Gigantopelta aegis TaxID=2794934 RepID=UPI001BE497C4|nr:hypothetical protein [sulfur-oxidizing endosymbiont of Gigantopelta aegis]